jgi:hypothetical protein
VDEKLKYLKEERLSFPNSPKSNYDIKCSNPRGIDSLVSFDIAATE